MYMYKTGTYQKGACCEAASYNWPQIKSFSVGYQENMTLHLIDLTMNLNVLTSMI